MLGRTCACPGCREQVVIHLAIPSDADINLVEDDGKRRR
jgi:hypothetical protein